jgi:two-component system OmpR family sensor kinase/two-component system sensor histidine kinase BaeS
MRRGIPDVTLTDASGAVLYDRVGRREVGTLVTERQRSAGLALRADGEVVGYLLADFPAPALLSESAQAFLRQVDRALLQAGLLAAGLGVVLGIIIAQGMSRPLSRLAGAARNISRGELHHRVPIEGTREVADLALAFNEMAAGLERAETLRANMVADIAHELRTPLTVIRGSLRAILDDVYPLEKAEVATIYDETIMLGRLVDDLRDLATAEAGQMTLHRAVVDLPAALEGAVAAFAEMARDKGVALQTHWPAALPPVLADIDRLRQVVRNLVDNAVRHTPPGGTVSVEAFAEAASRGAGAAAPGLVRVVVADTGPGIPSEHLPHVFDRFWRAEASRSREHGGSGLGLAIARQLVEAHGGAIGVEAVPADGSRFWFTLPVVEDQEETAPA